MGNRNEGPKLGIGFTITVSLQPLIPPHVVLGTPNSSRAIKDDGLEHPVVTRGISMKTSPAVGIMGRRKSRTAVG